MTQPISHTVLILAPPATVWQFLCEPALMKQWMGEEEMELEVLTNWQPGSSILIKGNHNGQFENKGRVLCFQPLKKLQYSHLSSVSNLADVTENYTNIAFELSPNELNTLLKISVTGFPTEIIFKHLEFYWRASIHLLKRTVEQYETTKEVNQHY